VSTRRNAKKASDFNTRRGVSSRRRVIVLISLVGLLTGTSALLLALAPAPLHPQASSSLFAIDAPPSMDVIFDLVSVPLTTNRWQYVYVHHSAALSGSAATLSEGAAGLADHFVIGNGDGCADGEIQVGQRWTQQLPPARSNGATSIVPNCISICLIGDFNQTRPTPTQQRRLAQLVSALQVRLHIPRTRVWYDPKGDNAAGIGAYFPAREFQNQILP